MLTYASLEFSMILQFSHKKHHITDKAIIAFILEFIFKLINYIYLIKFKSYEIWVMNNYLL